MSLNLLPDVGAPVTVAGVNIMARQSTSTVMGQPVSDVLVYGMAAGGLVAGHMGWGGRNNDYFKNIGVSAMALAAEKLYDALKGGTTQSMAMKMSRQGIGRYPAPAMETPFQGDRLSARLV